MTDRGTEEATWPLQGSSEAARSRIDGVGKNAASAMASSGGCAAGATRTKPSKWGWLGHVNKYRLQHLHGAAAGGAPPPPPVRVKDVVELKRQLKAELQAELVQ